MEPATQAVQALFVVTVQAVEAYVPAAQVAHVVQEAALVVVLKVDPATQETHPVFARAVQVVDRYVPAAHTVHALHMRLTVVEQAVD